MSAIDQFFRDRGVPIDEARVLEALETLLGDRVGATGAVALPAGDAELLARHSGVEPRSQRGPDAAAAAAADAAAAVTALVAGALTVAEVAERAGVSPSRVRHWIADGQVHALRVGGRNLLPTWQLGPDGRPLPHLGEVLDALPDDLHPLAVAGFFATPQPELDLGGRAVDATTWLLSGGRVDLVVDLAGALALAG